MRYVLSMFGIAAVAIVVAGGIVILQERNDRERQQRIAFIASPEPDPLGVAADLQTASGCRHVESSQTSDGKNIVLAQFQDRAAVVSWLGGGLRQHLGQSLNDDRLAQLVAQVPQRPGPLTAVTTLSRHPMPRFMADRGASPAYDVVVEYFEPLAVGGVAVSPCAPLDRAARGS